MLIQGAELEDSAIADIRVADGTIVAIGRLEPGPDETIVAARGGLLLPGLHDHHIHLAAFAASRASVRCGPPQVHDYASLASALRAAPGTGWLRGIGYHESVAGLPDAAMLDGIVPDRPVRMQHRGGRMWFLNSAALALLEDHAPPDGLERTDGRATGRLFEADAWLRAAIGGAYPDLADVAAMLARYGVTGVTEISPANDRTIAAHLARQRGTGALSQRVLLAGRHSLSDAAMPAGIALGPVKLHLHDAALPALDEAIAFIARAHDRDRAVAVHCVTEAELILTLGAFREAGSIAGDRIEHASVAHGFAIEEIAAQGIAVVAQPHFIAERGDAYLRDLAPEIHPLLYRLAAFRDAGVTLAAGSDAPFGGADPWAAMAAAVSRRTRTGVAIGAAEALTPEHALDLYLRAPDALDRRRRIEVGAAADLCLLDRPWSEARTSLSADHVRATFVAGRCIHDRVDQPPG